MRTQRSFFIILIAGILSLRSAALADWGTAKRLTWTPVESRYPAMAIDSSDAVHVVWDDDTPGNYEIYYRKGS